MNSEPLPPGQFELGEFPRFGLGKFAARFPKQLAPIRVEIGGDVETELVLESPLDDLPRQELTADFHCVTSWSVRNRQWGGVSFSDFFAHCVLDRARPRTGAELVVLHGEDGYRTSLPIQDLLVEGVLLADQLDGESLGVEHGAPLRLVAPAHYGFKNVKHISRIEFWTDGRNYRFPFPYPRFMDHPRARVSFEERGRFFPGWMLRYLYRLLIPFSIANFKRKTKAYHARAAHKA